MRRGLSMSSRTSILGPILLFAVTASSQELKCPSTQGQEASLQRSRL
jgi:hypothetical protein